MRHLGIALLFAWGAVLGARQAGPQAEAYWVKDPVLIRTRDGAEISAIVAGKRGAPPKLPAVLFFTTYFEGPGDADFAKQAADHGYVGIVAYSRGIRSHAAPYTPYVHDGDDADDVIRWISRQPWCDGQVGMFGGSYTGFVQWSALRHPPAALKTVVPQVAVMPGFDFPMENNVHLSFALGWLDSVMGLPPPPQDLMPTWYEQGAAFADLDRLAGRPNPVFQAWLQHPAYDAFWRSLVPTPQAYARLRLPILVTDGYWDGAQIASLQYVRDYLRANPHPNLYAVVGPYDHLGAQRMHPEKTLGGYAIDRAADVSMRELVYQWFDYVMKGRPRPELLQDRINVEVMGANAWRHAPTLEALHDRVQTYYLSPDADGPTHRLDPVPPTRRAALSQTVDFKDRTTQNNYFTPTNVLDQLDPSQGLVFATAPFDHAVDVVGSFAGRLSLAINKRDLDLSLAFYEQMPDGRYLFLTRYLGRASYAQDRGRRHLLVPGRKTFIPLHDTNLTARRFAKGSRLVVILNVNKHPFDEINYGGAGDVSRQTVKDAGEPLVVQWFNDSCLTVPLRDADGSPQPGPKIPLAQASSGL